MRRSPDLARRVTRRPWRRPDRRLSSGGGSVGTVTFPTTRLQFRVYIALGADLAASWLTWAWEDITRYVRFQDGISTRTGRPDESGVVTPGRTVLTLDNRDGRFSRRNPTGPYYGLLSKNTPIWIQVDAGSGFRTRVQHHVNEWPTRWDKSRNDSTVTIVASGILRRLGQGSVARSALYWSLIAADPVAYWPLEDGTTATAGASALLGGTPMIAAGSAAWAGEDDLTGSQAAPTITSTRLSGAIFGGAAAAWWLSFCIKAPFASLDAVKVRTGPTHGTFALFRFVWPSAVGQQLQCFIHDSDQSSTVGTVDGPVTTAAWADSWHHIGLAVSQNDAAGQATATLWVDGVQTDTLTDNNVDLDPLASIEVNPSAGAITSVAHVICGDGGDPGFAGYASAALRGYAGELAKVRIARMCSEGSIAFLAGGADKSQALGPQPVGTRLDVMRDAEAADLGVLYETDFGLAYQAKMGRYNAPVLLALDFNQGHIAEPPQPADDDQRTRNRFTASRSGGSEATVEDEVSIAVEGFYDDSATVNTYTDDQLANVAGWRVHQGTIDEDRWPAIEFNFTGTPDLIDTWTGLGYGARIAAAHPPSEVAPDPIDGFIEGHAERFDPTSWRAGVNTTPASTYEAFQAESTTGNRGRADTGGSVLTAAVSDAATSLSVTVTGVALWVTGSVNFDIAVGGERMTVTNISGGSSPQTFTVTRAVNGVTKAQAAGSTVKLWRAGVAAL